MVEGEARSRSAQVAPCERQVGHPGLQLLVVAVGMRHPQEAAIDWPPHEGARRLANEGNARGHSLASGMSETPGLPAYWKSCTAHTWPSGLVW